MLWIFLALLIVILIMALQFTGILKKRVHALFTECLEGGFRKDFVQFAFFGAAIEVNKTSEKPVTTIHFKIKDDINE